MKKDQLPPVSEQCTEEETVFGQQVVPKSSGTTAIDVVSARPSLSPLLSKNLALPFTNLALPFMKAAEQQSYPLHETKCPEELAVGKGVMAFSDSNASFVSAISQLNRSAFGHSKFDLPNESIELEKKTLDVAIQGINNEIVASILKYFAASGDAYLRKCPGGRGSTGNGAVSGGGNGAPQQWVMGCIGGASSGSYLPSGSGNGDDDPFHNYRPMEIPNGHYLESGFQSEDHLDKLTEEILKDSELFRELDHLIDLQPVQQPLEFQTLPAEAHPSRGGHFEESDPAPMTPGGPMTPYMPITSPAQSNPPVSELLEIHNLLKSPPTSVQQQQFSIAQQPTSPGYANLPNVMVGHQTTSVYGSQIPSANIVLPASYQQQQQQQQSSPSDFFVMTQSFNGKDRCIRMSIKNQGDRQAYQALQFSHDLFSKYYMILQKKCMLPIATQEKAKLCSMKVDMHVSLTFSMPCDCIPLNEWVVKNDDLRSRHLVIQQVLNALVVLFQGENHLSFWGSFEVFVASNMQAYLYIDFNKSLAIQKVYADSGQFNSRVEDCRVLKQLFELLLLPYLSNSLVSPQLNSILTTFKQLLTSQDTFCAQQIAMMARVMGERRICCMQAQIHGYPFGYTIYSVEQEPVSHSLGILKSHVMGAVQRPCVVLHEDFTPVSATEVSARHTHGHGNHVYVLMSQDFAGQQRIPGALYIEQ